MSVNIGKVTNLGKIIYENEYCAVCVEEVREDKDEILHISVLQKKDGHIYYPLGIILGSNGLMYEYKKDKK